MFRFCFFVVAGVAAVVAGGMATPQEDIDSQILAAENKLVALKSEKAAAVATAQDKIELSASEAKEAAGDKFHISVLKAAKTAWKKKELSWRNYRKIRRAMLIPRIRAEAEEMAVWTMKTSDADGTGAVIERIDWENIDWDEFLDFLEKFLEILLRFIDALAFDQPASESKLA